MPASLIVVKGRGEGRRIPITTPQFLIGRDARCHLRPKSPTVSKWHCVLLIRQNRVYIRDLNSLNGTYVNGQRIRTQVLLRDGDLIAVGPLVFSVSIQEPLEGRPDAPPPPTDLEDAVLDWVLNEPWTGTLDEPSSGHATTVMEAPVQQEKPAEAKKPAPTEEDAKASPPKPSSTAEVAGRLLDALFEPRRKS